MTTSMLSRLLATALLLGTCTLLQQSAPNRLSQADRLHLQAERLLNQRQFEAGLRIAGQELALRERANTEWRQLGVALRVLGDLHREVGNFAEAARCFERAMAVLERRLGSEHAEVASPMGQLASLYSITGEYAKAEPLHQRVLAIREKTLGPMHAETAKALNALGTFYLKTGEDAKGLPLLQRALQIKEQVFGPEHVESAMALTNLGILYYGTDEFEKAEELMLRAQKIMNKQLQPDDSRLAPLLVSLASLYSDTGEYSKTVELAQRALAIMEKTYGAADIRVAFALENLATGYHMLDDYTKAESLYRRSLDIRERALGKDHPDTARTVFHLAEAYKHTDAYTQAEILHRRALAIRESSLGKEHQDTAESLDYLGRLYVMTGAHHKAEPLLLRSLQIRERLLGPDHPDTASSLEDLAYLYWATNAPAKALALLQRAQQIRTQAQESFLVAGSEARGQSFLRHVSYGAQQDVSFSIAMQSPASAELGLISMLDYKGRVADVVSDSVGRLRRNLRAEDREVFEELTQIAKELSMLSYQSDDAASEQARRQRVGALTKRQEELETQLSERSSEFRQQKSKLTLAGVQAVIPDNAALVEWFHYSPFDPRINKTHEQWNGAPRYVAYVLKHKGKAVAVDLGPAADIDPLVRALRMAASNPAREDVRRHAAALFSKLLAPLRSHLRGVAHLLLSPDGELNFVPMAALLDEQGRYLAERFEVSYLTSGRDLLRLAAPTPRGAAAAVVMANPNFGIRAGMMAQASPPTRGERQRSEDLDRSGLVFRSLPGTELEARAIMALLDAPKSAGGGARILIGDEATESALKQLHGPRILHLATHGFFLSAQNGRRAFRELPTLSGSGTENPLLRSGIALAGANTRHSGSEDGILTALEASRLDLQGTQLVVLSACETALGEARTGDGIAGLRRGLLFAGAQTQIASLWKVADLPTKELMVSFYRELLEGAGRSAALRRAQLALLASPAQSHPYYWAGFVAIGDWTAVRNTSAMSRE